MQLKKNIKRIITIAGLVFVAGSFVFLILLACLPSLVESRLKNSLPQISKNRSIEFTIEKIGFFNAVVSDIHIADGITIDAVNVTYSLWPLSAPQINKVSVSGLTLAAAVNGAGQIQIPGIDLTDTAGSPSEASNNFLSYLPQKIAVKSSKIILDIDAQDILIPLEVLCRIKSENDTLAVDAAVFVFGEKIEGSLQYSQTSGIENIGIQARSFDTAHLNPFVLKISDQIQLMGPVDFKLAALSVQKKWRLDISQIIFKQASAQTTVGKIRSDILLDNETIRASGDFSLKVANFPQSGVKFSAAYGLADNHPFSAQFHTDPAKEVQIKQNTGVLSFVSPKATGTIKGDAGAVDAVITVDCEQVNLEEKNLSFDRGKLQWNIHADMASGKRDVEIKADFSIPRIRFKDQPAVFTRGKIVQTGATAFRVDGVAGSRAISQAKILYNVHLDLETSKQARVDLNIPQFKLTHSDVKRWVPREFREGQFDAFVSARGKVEWEKNGGLKTELVFGLTDGNFQMPDSKLMVSGINTAVKFNDLLVPETIPGQILTIDRIELDTVKINDAQVKFSVEDGVSVLVENVRFRWCDGTVMTQAMRFPQEKGKYEALLYCDRLDLAQFLKQMKIFNVEGSGTMNGRIPVAYSDGVISFDNGFLFSSPGAGGKLKIEDTEKITRGIPMSDPGFIQLDLTREALKDFDYTWANLSFHTFDDALYLNVSINGKPAKNLPFEPLEKGGFVRVDDSKPGSELEGLQLDVNLNLPFNEAMKFGNKLKSLFK